MKQFPITRLLITYLLLGAGPALAQTQSVQSQPTTELDAAKPDHADHVNFRHIESEPPDIDLNAAGPVRFLIDASFPPFSYKTASGKLTGFNVTLADALCKDLRLNCEFIIKPWDMLQSSLANGQGNAILSGVRITKRSFDALDFTKPFFRPAAKFIVRTGNPLEEPTTRALAGKRIGVAAGSVHEAFLKSYFRRSKILPNKNMAEAREALRQGQLDALFEDSVKAMFWITGSASRGCCRFAGGGFRDRAHLDAALSIAVKRGDTKLRDILDHGLDRLQTSGQLIRIYRNFFPLDAW